MMGKSAFEMIREVMENGGGKALIYAWIITALIICWVYVIPILIHELIELKKQDEELKDFERKLKELNENEKFGK